MAAELFPQAIQVLDVFHALEKIGDVVADNFKDKKERAHEFRLLKVWLKRGSLDAVLKRLSNMQNAKTTIRYCRTYWEATPSFSVACIRDW